MSNFPGDRFAYDNPLISTFNPWTQSFTPAIPGGTLVPWNTNTKTFGITMSARIRAFHVIRAALKTPKVGEYLYEGDWAYHTPAQRDFEFFVSRFKTQLPIENGTKLKISSNYNEINRFFQQNGSAAKMSKFNPNAGYGVGLISQMSYKWAQTAQDSVLNGYKSLDFTKGYEILQGKDNFNLPLIRIKTTNPHVTAVIKMTDPKYNSKSPYQPIFNFLDLRRWRGFYTPITKDYSVLRIPQILAEIEEDVDHLNGMCLRKYNKKDGLFESFTIQGIKQQTMVDINANGVNIGSTLQVKSLNRKEGFTRPAFVVDKPFLFWLEHDEILSYPLFTGFFNRDSWKS